MLIETHAHLDYPDFANDLDDVLRRANDAGVTCIITIGTSLESSRRAIDLAEKHSAIFAAIGVHPTSVEEAEDDVITPLRQLAKNPRVVAIGETGLDYHRLPSEKVAKEEQVQVMSALRTETDEEIEAQIRDGAYKSKQASLFQQQLDLAVELGLNVVVHQRDASRAAVAAAAVAFANARQVVLQGLFYPGVGAYGNLGAEARGRDRHGIG